MVAGLPLWALVTRQGVVDLLFDAARVPHIPQSQDGEVAGFELMSPDRVEQLAQRVEMKLDAALVTLDFLRRHRLLGTP